MVFNVKKNIKTIRLNCNMYEFVEGLVNLINSNEFVNLIIGFYQQINIQSKWQ